MEQLTIGQTIVVVIGAVLALCGMISTIGGAVEKVARARKAIKAPEQRQDDEISGIKTRLDKIERKLENDKREIADSKECNHVLTKGMLALLEHGINGNNIDQMKDAKKDVNTYLINH